MDDNQVDTPPNNSTNSSSGSGGRPEYLSVPSSSVTLSLDLDRYTNLMAVQRQRMAYCEEKMREHQNKMFHYQHQARIEAEGYQDFAKVAECISQMIEDQKRLNRGPS